MSITYRKVKGKAVICKGDVYIGFTDERLKTLGLILLDIEAGTDYYYQKDARHKPNKD